jgi:hypothetical protein
MPLEGKELGTISSLEAEVGEGGLHLVGQILSLLCGNVQVPDGVFSHHPRGIWAYILMKTWT